MEVEGLPVADAYLVHLDRQPDAAGWTDTTWSEAGFAAAGIALTPVQASVARNVSAGTLRGLHLQRAPHDEGKLVRCLAGVVFDVVVDLRRRSATFGRVATVTLDSDSPRALYVPPGCAQGYLTLEPRTDLVYLMDTRFVPGSGVGIRWDDPSLGIDWPRRPAVLSTGDRMLPLLSGLDPDLLP